MVRDQKEKEEKNDEDDEDDDNGQWYWTSLINGHNRNKNTQVTNVAKGVWEPMEVVWAKCYAWDTNTFGQLDVLTDS